MSLVVAMVVKPILTLSSLLLLNYITKNIHLSVQLVTRFFIVLMLQNRCTIYYSFSINDAPSGRYRHHRLLVAGRDRHESQEKQGNSEEGNKQ